MKEINGRKIVALHCERVEGLYVRNILARVGIVDYNGNVIFNSFVTSPDEVICDYRTPYSGIRRMDLIGAPSFSSVQRKVRDIISDKIVVGHTLKNDLESLDLKHPIQHQRDIVDTKLIIQKFGNSMGQPVSLKTMTYQTFGRRIQVDKHDSIEDATATMDIYKYYQNTIENEHKVIFGSSMEMETAESELIGGVGGVVLVGLAVASALAAFGIFNRNRNE